MTILQKINSLTWWNELVKLKDILTDLSEASNTPLSETSYSTNTEAVAALGIGVLYKSTTLINGSPIILITA